MPLPLAPIAGFALRSGAVALAAYAVTRSIERGFFDQRAEEAMDDVPEGTTFWNDGAQTNATTRFRRTVRLGNNGPGFMLDVTALGRIRLHRL